MGTVAKQIISLLLGVHLLLGMFAAVSSDFHEECHQESRQSAHLCLAALLSSDQLDCAEVTLVYSPVSTLPASRNAPLPLLVSSILSTLPSERAPPVLS